MSLIGSRIKNIRKTKKISQKKLAETIGCATVSIQKYESNERTPSLKVLSNIAAALGVLVSELIDYEVPKDMDIKTGERIKEIRKSKRITQKEMSNILNINIRTYQKYESDEISLNLDTLKKIAAALDIKVNELIDCEDYKDIDYGIGEKIRELRKSKGLKLKDLAKSLNISEQALSQYERNIRNINLEMLKKIAIALDVSMFALIDNYTVNRDMNIGERIKELRKSKNLTQKQLGEKIGVTATTITKYENNQLSINTDTLSKIAIALGVTVSDILGESLPSKNLTLENFTTEELLEEIKRRAIKYGL